MSIVKTITAAALAFAVAAPAFAQDRDAPVVPGPVTVNGPAVVTPAPTGTVVPSGIVGGAGAATLPNEVLIGGAVVGLGLVAIVAGGGGGGSGTGTTSVGSLFN